MRDSFNFLLELLFLAGAPFRSMEARWADGVRSAVLCCAVLDSVLHQK